MKKQKETQQGEGKRYMTFAEALAYLGVGRTTMNKLINERQISFYRPTRCYLFTREDLDSFMNSARVTALDRQTIY